MKKRTKQRLFRLVLPLAVAILMIHSAVERDMEVLLLTLVNPVVATVCQDDRGEQEGSFQGTDFAVGPRPMSQRLSVDVDQVDLLA